MILVPLDFYKRLLSKAKKDEYHYFSEFVLTSLKYFEDKPMSVKIDALRKAVRHGRI